VSGIILKAQLRVKCFSSFHIFTAQIGPRKPKQTFMLNFTNGSVATVSLIAHKKFQADIAFAATDTLKF